MKSFTTLAIFFFIIAIVSSLTVSADVLDSLRNQQHNHLHAKKINNNKHAAAVKQQMGFRRNVTFTPLDPNNTNPEDFWMAVHNPVPNSYCERPRYPVVPSEGDIAMDILYDVYPNGTIPKVPPKPTNTWLKNLWGFEFNNTGSWGGVYPYPYIVQPRAYQVSMMYPGAPRNLSGNRAMSQGFARPGPVPAGNPEIHNASYPYLTMASSFDWAVQVLNGEFPRLAEVTPLSARVEYFSTKKNDTAVAKLHIVKGSPFVTMEFNEASLKFGCIAGPGCPMPPIVGMNNLPPGSKVTSTKFTFHVAEGPLHAEARKWHVYFTSPVTITLPNPPNRPLSIMGRGPGGSYTGLAKFASGEFADDEEELLNNISHTVAIGADIEYDINDQEDKSAVRFRWKTIGHGPLTMLALPHHLKLLPKNLKRTKTSYWSVKGNMTAVEGNVWNMTYNLTSGIGFGENHPIPASKQEIVKKAALFDYNLRINMCPGDNDTYNGTEGLPGAQSMELYAYIRDLSQYSEIAIVLENLGLRTEAIALTKKMLSCMTWVMRRPVSLPKPCPPPINNTLQCVTNMTDIYYDNKFGGLITGWYDRFAPHYCQCDKPGGPDACKGLNYCDNVEGFDAMANYGFALYNNAKMVGYVLKSVSWAIYYQETLNAKLNLTKGEIKNMTKQALVFARNVANPDDQKDNYFTYNRNKDVFDGHSWSEGYDYSGRILTWVNQQSGSEAVNSYFGVYLLGVAINDTNVRDWGRINMATEAFSIHTYQHITNQTEEDAHQPTPEINKWGKVVSILMGNGASGATYFGPGALFETGITLLPITPYHKEWIRKEWASEAAEWIRWRNNRSGECAFFNPLNQSQVGNNPCPGAENNKSFTANAFSCCATNDGFPLNQWRAWPNWYAYLYVLDALAGNAESAFSKLQYTEGFDKPTKDLPFPYVYNNNNVVGIQHDLTLTQALFFVASELPK